MEARKLKNKNYSIFSTNDQLNSPQKVRLLTYKICRKEYHTIFEIQNKLARKFKINSFNHCDINITFLLEQCEY